MTALPAAGLLSRSAGLTAARVLGSAASFLTQLLLARSMGTDDLGLFYIVTSMAIVLGTVAAIGYPGIANHLIVRYRSRDDKRLLKAFVATARRDTWIASALIACGTIATVAIATNGEPGLLWPTVLAAVAIPAFTTLRVNGGFANAVQRFALSFLPDNFIRPVLFVAVLAAILSFYGSLDLIPVVGAFTALTVALAIVQTIVLRRSGEIPGPAVKPDRRPKRHWRKSGARLVVPLLITNLFADISILFSGLILDPSDVAVFGLCVKIAFLSGFFIQVVHQITMPRFAESVRARNHAGVKTLIGKTNTVAVSSMAVAFLVTGLAGEEILDFFGPQFVTGISVLLILVGAQLVRAMGGPAMSLLIASGMHARAIPVIASSLAFFLVTLFMLAPPLGVTGAALAVLAATMVSSAGLAAVVYRHLGYRCGILAMFRPGPSTTGLASPRIFQGRAI